MMQRARWERRLQQLWYGRSGLATFLLPLSGLFCLLVWARQRAYRAGLLTTRRLDARVIVVGNITLGGSGKTSLTLALARCLAAADYRVGILCRGYRGKASGWPRRVTASSDPARVGDDAVWLARSSGVAVYAGPDRAAAGRALLAATPVDVLICDDGLQHYALGRDLEIIVVDADRGLGNGHCLPAGPLREPASRLRRADAQVWLGGATAERFGMRLEPGSAVRLCDPAERRSLDAFCAQRVHAVAGTGHPQRFFAALRAAGLDVEPHAFADHHAFTPRDLAFPDQRPVLMTEKDAVKCSGFAQAHWWSVAAEVRLDAALVAWLLDSLVTG
jgi:tetraacyldisaccharide 4'-kinase